MASERSMQRLLVAMVALSALALAQTTPAWQEPLALQKWAEAETLLKQALKDGTLSKSRIDEAATRIIALKMQYHLMPATAPQT